MSRKRLAGRIVANKMAKTVVVAVERKKRHPLYEKVLSKVKKYKAHAEEKIPVGAEVVIEQTRPLSREKRWRVVEVRPRPAPLGGTGTGVMVEKIRKGERG